MMSTRVQFLTDISSTYHFRTTDMFFEIQAWSHFVCKLGNDFFVNQAWRFSLVTRYFHVSILLHLVLWICHEIDTISMNVWNLSTNQWPGRQISYIKRQNYKCDKFGWPACQTKYRLELYRVMFKSCDNYLWFLCCPHFCGCICDCVPA